jgi:hypothetical protein
VETASLTTLVRLQSIVLVMSMMLSGIIIASRNLDVWVFFLAKSGLTLYP